MSSPATSEADPAIGTLKMNEIYSFSSKFMRAAPIRAHIGRLLYRGEDSEVYSARIVGSVFEGYIIKASYRYSKNPHRSASLDQERLGSDISQYLYARKVAGTVGTIGVCCSCAEFGVLQLSTEYVPLRRLSSHIIDHLKKNEDQKVSIFLGVLKSLLEIAAGYQELNLSHLMPAEFQCLLLRDNIDPKSICLSHNDIKLDNLFYDVRKKCLRIGDFGSSNFANFRYSSLALTPAHAPPEFKNTVDALFAVYPSSDSFLSVMTAAELVFGNVPTQESLNVLIESIDHTKTKAILRALVAEDAGCRFTPRQALTAGLESGALPMVGMGMIAQILTSAYDNLHHLDPVIDRQSFTSLEIQTFPRSEPRPQQSSGEVQQLIVAPASSAAFAPPFDSGVPRATGDIFPKPVVDINELTLAVCAAYDAACDSKRSRPLNPAGLVPLVEFVYQNYNPNELSNTHIAEKCHLWDESNQTGLTLTQAIIRAVYQAFINL